MVSRSRRGIGDHQLAAGKCYTFSIATTGCISGRVPRLLDIIVGAAFHEKVSQSWQPLSLFAKQLNAAQRNCSTYNHELLAAYLSIKHFRLHPCRSRFFGNRVESTHSDCTLKASPRRYASLDSLKSFFQVAIVIRRRSKRRVYSNITTPQVFFPKLPSTRTCLDQCWPGSEMCVWEEVVLDTLVSHFISKVYH